MKVSYLDEYEIKDKQAREDIETINRNIENLNVSNKCSGLVVIGDSYGVGYTDNDVIITSYAERLKTILNLDDNHFYCNSWGGSGFSCGGKKFIDLINECNTNITSVNRQNISHVLIAGGYNDQFIEYGTIVSEIPSCINKAKELFPNAKILVAFIGWCNNGKGQDISGAWRAYIDGVGQVSDATFIAGSQYILTSDKLSSDKIHPNQDGYNEIAYRLKTGLLTGVCSTSSSFQYVSSEDKNWGTIQQNDNISVFDLYDYEYVGNGIADGTEITIGTLKNNNLLSGNGNFKHRLGCIFVDANNGKYINGYIILSINQGVIKIRPYAINNDGTGYFNYTHIRISGESIVIPRQYT